MNPNQNDQLQTPPIQAVNAPAPAFQEAELQQLIGALSPVLQQAVNNAIAAQISALGTTPAPEATPAAPVATPATPAPAPTVEDEKAKAKAAVEDLAVKAMAEQLGNIPVEQARKVFAAMSVEKQKAFCYKVLNTTPAPRWYSVFLLGVPHDIALMKANGAGIVHGGQNIAAKGGWVAFGAYKLVGWIFS